VNITVVLLSDMKLYSTVWLGTQCTDVKPTLNVAVSFSE